MPSDDFVMSVPVIRSARVMQLESLFELPPTQRSERVYSVHLPIEERPWNIGLIVGPSGSGKSTVARHLFGDCLVKSFHWSPDRSIVDDFPNEMGIKEITAILSSVGFSSPPSWLRPYGALSNGEQFRVTLARAIAESKGQLFVLDEYTSVVDRTVAQIGSAVVAKAIRQRQAQFIAVTCHYDVLDWLQPDWVYEPHVNQFRWRSLQRRPALEITIRRVDKAAWELFKHHHYLDTKLNRIAACYMAMLDGNTPAAFTAALHFPHPRRSGWREHRTVCLPDYQGVGIGNALSEFVASLYVTTGRPYRSVTGNPAMIRHRSRSPLWKMLGKPQQGMAIGSKTTRPELRRTQATNRVVASFEYVGPPNYEAARGFGVI